MKRTALVTGANKGIGFEIARQLGKEGIRVYLGARDEEKGKEAARKLCSEDLDVTFVKIDMNDRKTFGKAAEFINNDAGVLDILVNNAGIQVELPAWQGNTVTTVSEADLKQTFETNFFSVVVLTQILLPLIRKSKAGRIVNMSSIMGSLSLHGDSSSPIYKSKPFAYDASKTALNQFTVHLAEALASEDIKVNSAHPGWVKTELGSEYAPMDVEEGARTAVMLATLGADGPTGGYYHLGKPLPW